MRVIGESHLKNPIELTRFGTGSVPVLLIGGVHGDEPEGFTLAEMYRNALTEARISVSDRVSLFVSPRINPDGCAVSRRTNHRNVDLNRNLPTRDWLGEFTNVRYYPGPKAGSEPETQALLKLLDEIRPQLILSMHSYDKPMINFNGTASEPVARVMGEINGLPPKGDIGYPTPGCLGAYAEAERGIPTVTLEILRDQDVRQVWELHHGALSAALNFAAQTLTS